MLLYSTLCHFSSSYLQQPQSSFSNTFNTWFISPVFSRFIKLWQSFFKRWFFQRQSQAVFSAHVFHILCTFGRTKFHLTRTEIIEVLPFKYHIMYLFPLNLYLYESNLSETVSANSKKLVSIFGPRQATWLKLLPMQSPMQVMWIPVSTKVTLEKVD